MVRRRRRGLGAVRVRDGRFQADIQLEGRRYWQTFEREADAWDWVATVKADAVRGVLKIEEKPRVVRFDDLCRLYRVHKARTWRPGTARFFDEHVKGALLPRFGRRPISEITAADIHSFLDARLEAVSPMTVTKGQQILAQVFNYAVRMGWLGRSPMLGVERVRATAKPPRVFRLHELQAILSRCPQHHASFFTILALTGLRKSEMFRFSWGWCDFEREKLLIKEAKRGSNEMPMSARVKAALMALGPQREGLVFPGRNGNGSTVDEVPGERLLTDKRRALARVLAVAGVPPEGVGFHTFRHTFITLVEQIPGVSYSVARALARHSVHSGDITARYLHPSDDSLRWALGQLEDRVFGPTNVVLLPREMRG